MGAIVFAFGFLLGRKSIVEEREEIISDTIDYLIQDGYLKTQENVKGEIELLKLKD